MKELIRVRLQYALRQQCCKTHKRPLTLPLTDALNSNFIGMTTLHVSGSLSAHRQEFRAVRRLWYILCSLMNRLLPGVGWHSRVILLLVAASTILKGVSRGLSKGIETEENHDNLCRATR